MKQPEQTSCAERPQRKRTVFSRFLENALIEKYDATIGFAGKSLWPILVFSLSLAFYPNISFLLSQLSTNLARTSKINVAGLEIEIYADSLRSSDLEAYQIIEAVSREDLLTILDLGETRLQVSLADYTPEYRAIFEELIDQELISVDSDAVSVQNSAPVVEITLTDLGKRVHRELQSILVNFVNYLNLVQ